MEMILGVIEDMLDQFYNGSPEEKEDSKQALTLNLGQFKENLQPLIDAGNDTAKDLCAKLENLQL